MFIDSFGLPRDNGATDMMDSARLAGLMAIVNHPLAPDLRRYLVGEEAVRHPYEYFSNNPKNFTRDQLICLAAGLHVQGHINSCKMLYNKAYYRGWFAQNTEYDAPGSIKRFPNGPDWLSPSNRMVLAKCAKKPGLFILGRLWLTADIVFNALFTPRREPNQLISQLVVAGPRWIKFYKKVTPEWRYAITDYWCGWRDEPALASSLIDLLEKY